MKLFVIGGHVSKQCDERERLRLVDACKSIGVAIAEAGHDLIVCSPFDGAADVAVLVGAAEQLRALGRKVEFNFVDSREARDKLESLEHDLGVEFIKIPHPAPHQNTSDDEVRYAWLLCQLRALESCHVVIAIGGKLGGSANMLLHLAESKRKPVIPIPLFGGAAEVAFERRRYELADRLGAQLALLQSDAALSEVSRLAAIVASGPSVNSDRLGRGPRFFISYPRARASEADFVEALLRRRNHEVFRDESDFGWACHTRRNS